MTLAGEHDYKCKLNDFFYISFAVIQEYRDINYPRRPKA